MQHNKLNAPWSLHFDRNGTDDVAIICDCNGDDLAQSRDFWLPTGDDPEPGTLIAMRLMKVAPEMFDALKQLLSHVNDLDRNTMSKRFRAAYRNAISVAAQADGRA